MVGERGGCVDLGGPFQLPPWLDFGATFIWALTGSLLAARRHYDIAGITALAFVSAAGGGLLRDGIFLQNAPPLFLRTWAYMALIAAAAVAVRLAGSRIQRIPYFDRTISIVDALGLGGFAVVGVQLSLQSGLSAPAAAFVGIINAVGGGVLRDLLIRREPIIFKPGPPEALAALAGCVVYLTLDRAPYFGEVVAGAAAVIAVFLIRLAAIRYGWKTGIARGFDPPDDADPRSG